MALEFWKLEHLPGRLAVIEAHTGLQKTYGELRADVQRTRTRMPMQPGKSLLMLLGQNRYACLLAYLAALQSGHALLLVDSSLNHDLLVQLVRTYRPDYIYGVAEDMTVPGYRTMLDDGLWSGESEIKEAVAIHDSLALLLNTSGSTGSPKLVRLTAKNLQSNAESIASYLNLTAAEKPITSLPMSYSYGLSVINSHLLVGGCLVLSEHGVLRREFWDTVDRFECTSFAGVPYTYQMMLQTGLLRQRGASIRTLTQAGGALSETHIRHVHQLALEQGCRFFVMYGQTEATARISYVPFESLGAKIGSIGIAIPNGSLQVDPLSGELVYAGPNVMLGYAECRDDLAKGDELHGELRTGDLARQDTDGFFYITGRMKRFLKLFGKRFNLDEVEQIIQSRFGFATACFGRDDLLMVAIESGEIEATGVAAMLREMFNLPGNAIRVEAMPKLPRTARGKMDYQALTSSQSNPVVAAGQARKTEMEIR